ncbi:MAG: homocysteine S-methyltransferase family protein [Candidatus Omnitrophica bacterium]|nr:homocysteine S-methyltransferase family protein [Candidatus Omnitrophota bacterium]
MKEKIKKLLTKRLVILDGATGTELQKRGMPQGVCPEAWCMEHPDVIAQIHREYQQSGADIVYTCTFGANPTKLKQYNISDVEGVNAKLARIAKSAIASNGLVAGSIGPTGVFVEPFGPVKFEEAVLSFKRQIKGLVDGGIDLLVIETMMDIQEARAALVAAKELTDKFIMVTMTIEQHGRTLNGTDPLTALITLQSLGADAVGCNCSTGPKEIAGFIATMKPYATVPLIAKPNAGLPQLKDGRTIFQMAPQEFSTCIKNIAEHGANMIGGCCGTTPEHIKAVKGMLNVFHPKPVARTSLGALSSAAMHFVLENRKKTAIVGEGINPTRRKALQQELREEKTSFVRQLAKDQEFSGAELLDVNVGAPGVDEEKALVSVINALSVSSKLPLVIDSSSVSAVEKALRVYPGRALINSISAEKKMGDLLKIASRYGAMFIALPVGIKGVPKTFDERKKNIQKIVSAAEKLHLTKDDIIVDGLVMAVSAAPKAGVETLETIRWCRRGFKIHTIVGLSNVSFGLPQRDELNSTFFYLLKKQGVSLVIANPAHLTHARNLKAEKVLLGKDIEARGFIAHCNKAKGQNKEERRQAVSPSDLIYNAILDGNREDIQNFIVAAEVQGMALSEIVNQVMIPAINKVGEFFEQKHYFLPQLIASAEAMKLAFDYIEPKLHTTQAGEAQKTVVILATVHGDIHDIGKNIVSLMLKNHGFHVVDLGKDVSAERIIGEVRRHKNPIVALSALMTTTMVNMEEVMRLAKEQNVKCRFMLGGAVVTKDYSEKLGAEYSKDGVEAVKVAKHLSASD